MALRYLEIVATTLGPSTVLLRADSLIIFGEYLAAHQPGVGRLEQLERAHIEAFLVWNDGRPWRGWLARDKPVAASVSKRTVVDPRSFFDDLAVWGWADRPPRQLVFASDIPRLDRPLPRALPPDSDRDLMTAVAGLADPFARHALAILRGTGMRLGALLDLELDCLWDFRDRGTWVKVAVGKLGTERTVPLDDATLADFDAWMARRGTQRALIHPRHGQPVDFLFVERGPTPVSLPAPRRPRSGRGRRRSHRKRHAATPRHTAPAQAHLRDHPRQRRHVTPSPDGTHGPRLRGDDAALRVSRFPDRSSRLRSRHEQGPRPPIPLRLAKGRPTAPDRVEWLRSEMLKTRIAHGCYSRDLIAEACLYANICEQCDNYLPAPEFQPALETQLADIVTLRDDTQQRAWESEIARHNRVITSIERHLRRLQNQPPGREVRGEFSAAGCLRNGDKRCDPWRLDLVLRDGPTFTLDTQHSSRRAGDTPHFGP